MNTAHQAKLEELKAEISEVDRKSSENCVVSPFLCVGKMLNADMPWGWCSCWRKCWRSCCNQCLGPKPRWEIGRGESSLFTRGWAEWGWLVSPFTIIKIIIKGGGWPGVPGLLWTLPPAHLPVSGGSYHLLRSHKYHPLLTRVLGRCSYNSSKNYCPWKFNFHEKLEHSHQHFPACKPLLKACPQCDTKYTDPPIRWTSTMLLISIYIKNIQMTNLQPNGRNVCILKIFQVSLCREAVSKILHKRINIGKLTNIKTYFARIGADCCALNSNCIGA